MEKIKVGNWVVRGSVPAMPKHTRNAGVGGKAAIWLSAPTTRYLVTEVTKNGGLKLAGFLLTVSSRDVIKSS